VRVDGIERSPDIITVLQQRAADLERTVQAL
jgi:hypothetical protein